MAIKADKSEIPFYTRVMRETFASSINILVCFTLSVLIVSSIFHNLSILRPRSLEEKEQKERKKERKKEKGGKKKKKKKSERFCYAFHFQLDAPLCIRVRELLPMSLNLRRHAGRGKSD